MSVDQASAAITAALSAVSGGVGVAAVNGWFQRRRTAAETDDAEASATEKIASSYAALLDRHVADQERTSAELQRLSAIVTEQGERIAVLEAERAKSDQALVECMHDCGLWRSRALHREATLTSIGVPFVPLPPHEETP